MRDFSADMKHAFLIIAHNEPEIFKVLVSLLDHKDCDIFVHIDRKTDMNLFRDVKTQFSEVYFIEDRNEVMWGRYSQIQTEIKLFRTAHSRGIYSYYHLMSGVDLPIKPIGQIVDWFENNKGYEYLGGKPAEKKYHKRMQRKYFFVTRKRNVATTLILVMQKISRVKWNRNTELWMGPNWGSFTDSFVSQIIDNETWIHKHFKRSFCGDELYKPTLMRHLKIEKKDRGSLRHIDWERGTPYTFQKEDLNELIQSDKLFARKFSSDHKEIIKSLEDHLRPHNIENQYHIHA